MTVELQRLTGDRIKASPTQIAEFCRRWHIVEFALFGSVLRNDFRPDSDIDVLVTFSPEFSLSWDDRMAMQEEIEALLDFIGNSRGKIKKIIFASHPFLIRLTSC